MNSQTRLRSAQAILVTSILLLSYCLGIPYVARSRTGETIAQPAFQISKLDTRWGTYDVDFAPDDRSVAIYEYKWDGAALVQRVEIRDFNNLKTVREKTIARFENKKVDTGNLDAGFIRYSGRMILVYEPEEGDLLLLNSDDLVEIRKIDLDKSAWPRTAPNPSGIHSSLVDVQIDQSGSRVAIALGWGAGVGGELRVYDLASGKLLKKWDFQKAGLGGISIDPEGQKVAVPLIPDRRTSSSQEVALVLDTNSGVTVAEISPGYTAAQVAFVGSDILATVSAESGVGAHKKDGIRLWDIKTRKLIREIKSPPTGVRYRLQISTDGKVALGYVGKEVSHWWWFDPASVVTEDQRFRLWDVTTGKVIATSPDVPPHSIFRLSHNGKNVLVYPYLAGGPLTSYTVSQKH